MVLARLDFPELLPGWIPWVAPVAMFLILSVFHLVIPVALVRRALRIDEATPWPERARWFHVARSATIMWIVLIPVVVTLAAAIVGPVSAVPRLALTGGLMVLFLFGAIQRWRKLETVVLGPVTWRESVGALLLGIGPLLLLIACAVVAPGTITSPWMLVWAIPVWAAAWLWTRGPLFLEKIGLAWPARDEVVAAVSRAAGDVGVAAPRILELDVAMINALAYPWLGVVAFTRRAADLFDASELEAIAAHELTHLNEPKSMMRMRLAVLYAFVPLAALRPLLGSFGMAALLVVPAFVALSVMLRTRARASEGMADDAAIEAAHRSAAFAEALLTLHRRSLIPAVLRKSTHGQLHERLISAGLEPDYDIPKPPPSWPGTAAWMAGLLAGVCIALAPTILGAVTEDWVLPNQLAAGIQLYGNEPARNLAIGAEYDGDPATAASWMEVAAYGDTRGQRTFFAVQAWALAGDCGQARAVLEGSADSMELSWRNDALDYVLWCEDRHQ